MDRSAGVRRRPLQHAHAHNVVTLPSHANILSGRLPREHGVHDNAGFRFPPVARHARDDLKARGYRTGAFVSAFPLDSRFGLARGFDGTTIGSPTRRAPHSSFRNEAVRETVAARAMDRSRSEAPVVLLGPPVRAALPLRPSASALPRDSPASYHGEVAAADAALQPLLEPISRPAATAERSWC